LKEWREYNKNKLYEYFIEIVKQLINYNFFLKRLLI